MPRIVCDCGCQSPISNPLTKRGLYRKYKRGHHPPTPWRDRLWEKLDKRGPLLRPDLGRCWRWLASFDRGGYAQFDTRKGFEHKAHRAVWKAVFGYIPVGLLVLHHCDNRGCVNPGHLFLGTHQDNSDDMTSKGRSAKGEQIGNSRITAACVRKIRRAHGTSGAGYRSVAKQFGVSFALVRDIVKGRIWRHVQ